MGPPNKNSMMWTTTYALGAFAFGVVLTYILYSIVIDEAHGLALRALALGALVVGGVALLWRLVRRRMTHVA